MQRRLRLKKLSLALTFIFLCSIFWGSLPVQPAYAEFSDIKGNWAEMQINDWVDRGLAGGYTDGTFRPGNRITRAEFVALTNRAFGKQDQTVRAEFKDVKESDWYHAEVAVAKAKGYCAGYTDGTFRPHNPVTRQEVASMVSRLLDLEAGTAGKSFADTGAIAPWAREAVNAVAVAGIMSGYTDGTFKGGNPITRAEAVVTLDRAISHANIIPIAEPGGITGSISLDGKAVGGAVVLLFTDNGNEPVKETTSDQDGKFAFQADAGIYDITVVKDKYVAYAAGVSLAGDGTVQDLALAEGTLISGRLVDKNGSAVKNAKLFFTTNPTFLTTTDGNGGFSVYVPAGKKYTIRGYKNNKPNSGLEILADNVEAGKGSNRSMGSIKASYALATPGGSGGGGGGNTTGTAAAPTASPAPGAVQAGTEVTLGTTTAGATIRYTTDGSEPSTTSTEYSAPITVAEAVTIKAKAYKNGWNASSTATFSYTVVSETVPVTAITVTGEGETTTVIVGESLQMTAAVEPEDATDPTVSWSVEDGTGTATINANGILTGTGAGTVTVKATANDGSGVDGTTLITVLEPGPFAGGDGSEENPYQVATAEQLDIIRNNLDKHFVQIANINLGIAPWNEEEGWLPIGDSDNPFTGSYNGDGYSITGLFINRNTDYTGLFGYLGEGGDITGVNIENAQVEGGDYTGILTGYAEKAAIKSCNVQGSVSGGYWVAGVMAGGIESSEIRGSSSQGDVSVYYYGGGLVGKAEFSTIKMSFSTADVTDGRRIGGLVGDLNYSHIEGCLAAGNVSGVESGGGLVHCLGGSSSVKSSYSLGNVTVTGNQAGGLAAEMWGDSFVSMSYAMGAVSGQSGVGGIVGNPSSGDISHSIGHNAQIDSTTGSTSIGRVAGNKSEDYNLFQNNHGYEKMKVSGNRVSSDDSTSRNGSDFLGFHEIQAAEIRDPAPFESWDFDVLDVDGNSIYWHWDEDICRPVLYVDPEGNENYIRLGNDARLIEPVTGDTPSDFAGGDGSADNPYQIATADQLDKVRDNLDKHFILTNDINLGVSPWNDGEGWVPIGDFSNPFTGSLDGNWHTISNLTMDRLDSYGMYQGLFGRISGGTIQRLGLEDFYNRGYSHSAGLVAYNEGSIIDCYAVGSVLGYSHAMGVLVGENNGVITRSYAGGSTEAENDSHNYTGGLVGRTGNGSAIFNCYSTVNVKGKNYVGGLVGHMFNGTISNCYAAGPVSGNNYVGGLVGNTYGDSVVNTNGYFNLETTTQTISAGGQGLTTAEMVQQSSFTGWDFSTVWEVTTGSYPYLQWQGENNIPYPPSVFTGGSGTEADPYEVATAEQLNKVRDYPDKHFIQTANIDLAGYLGVDGPEYNDGEGWRPVGDRYTSFNGTFDGNGYIISNLTINRPDNDYQGLFGYTGNNAELTGMALESLDVTGDMYVGGLVGQNNGHIEDCYTSGTVEGTYTQVGGLVGYNFAYSGAAGSIINSHSSAVVTGHEEVGGLVGYNSGGLISGSYASGDVTGVYDDGDEPEQIGGLVGDSGGRMENSHASGNVSGYEDIGGLAGSSNGEINSCYTTGTVSGTMEVGGLVGDCSGTINDSYAAGIVSGSSRVGGLVGSSYANITSSYANGQISGYEYLGGLIGYSGNGQIQKSFATGTVLMLGGVEAAVGGLAGSIQNTLVDDCYATGDVTGHKEVGGLVGYVSVGAEIDHCYAVGSVDKLNPTSYSLGGLIGATTSPAPTVTGSYYDQETTGQTDNGFGTPKTTEKMKQITTYVDWDFDTIWGINPDENDGYPFLRWLGYEHQPAATATLLGHWKCDESVGEAVYDSSGNDYNGTIMGATWTNDRNGESGKALEFGQNKWVNIPDTLKPEEITVCAWVYVTGTDGSEAPIFSAEKGLGGDGFSYRLQITPDATLRMEAIAPYSASGARVATSTEKLDLNRWYHVAGTYDGYDTKIYIDGVLVKSVSDDIYKMLKTDPAIPVAIGHLENWNVQWFRGKIDDARIYDGVLSEDEIRGLL